MGHNIPREQLVHHGRDIRRNMKDIVANLDEVQTSSPKQNSIDATHYGLNKITKEQADADKILRLQKKIAQAPTLDEAMNIASEAYEEEHPEGTVKIPNVISSDELKQTGHTNILSKIKKGISDIFKKAS